MAQEEGDVLRVVTQFKVGDEGTRCLNVFHYKVFTLFDNTDLTATNEMIAEQIGLITTVSPQLEVSFALENVRITNLTKRTFVGEGVGAGFSGGGGAANNAPAQVACLVIGRSRKLGFQGRKYVGPLLASAFTDGVLAAGAAAQFSLYADRYTKPVVGATLNTYNPGVPTIVNKVVTGFEEFVIDRWSVVKTARTMRTRIPARGLS